MRNLALTVAYEGTRYAGWQYQPDVPTVQGEVEQALRQITQQEVRLRGAGRTDAGVHARAQVANARLDSAIACEDLTRGLNALLPDDIVVNSVHDAPGDFEARRNNGGKHYRYSWWNQRLPSVVYHATTDHIYRELRLDAMAEAARLLIGTHDFAAFRAADCDRETTVRTLYRCTISHERPLVHLDVQGTAFLKHMTRIIAGTLLEVGTNKRSIQSVAELLRSGNRTAAGPTAPARGLTLMRVYTPWTVTLPS